ncbi:MHYT domain-containing protein [Natronoglycomyces albus]|uniref:MHYT domain-containing protein n=1 Tax=Natronoglycomyces albus TaxID=2811108 RepID=A0A895XK68_9ACTN|nr:MHYT domain-containing protein [Natronoglycomyces albus]QSB05734.1 hypothetical protein JQS30_02050 [Natronoglycomyces albus]
MEHLAHVSHFTYGWVNPVMGLGFAFAGSVIALICMSMARRQRRNRLRTKWIAFASMALGGTGIWMMHFAAMIGFNVTVSDVAYDPLITAVSLVVSIGSVAFGLFVVGYGKQSLLKVLIGGPLAGLGVVFMHYSGMAAVNISGTITHDSTYFWASVAIAVVAATVALGFGTWLDNRYAQIGAAALMAVAISSMHYTGMAGIQVTLHNDGRNPVSGIHPIMLILPIMVVATLVIIALLFGLMQRGQDSHKPLSWSEEPTRRQSDLEDETADGTTPPHRRPSPGPTASRQVHNEAEAAQPARPSHQASHTQWDTQAMDPVEIPGNPTAADGATQPQRPMQIYAQQRRIEQAQQRQGTPAPNTPESAPHQQPQPEDGVWAPSYDDPSSRRSSSRKKRNDPEDDDTFHFLKSISQQHPTVSHARQDEIPNPSRYSPTSSGQ